MLLSHSFRSAAPALLLTLLASCAPTVQRDLPVVEPSRDTILTRLEAAYSGRGQHIVVENRSSSPVVVTSIHLRECENVRNTCDVLRTRVRVAPGQSRQVLTVERSNAERPHRFRYSWTWEVERPEDSSR